MPPGFDIGEILATPGGTLIAAAMVIQGIVLVMLVYVLIKRPSTSGNGNGHTVELASQFATNQHQVIMGLLEGLGHIDTTLRAQQITLETLAKNEGNREARWELGNAKSDQQSDNIEALKSQQERLGNFMVTAVNKGEGREETYKALAESIQKTQSTMMTILSDIRRKFDPTPPPAEALPPRNVKPLDADGAKDATVDSGRNESTGAAA